MIGIEETKIKELDSIDFYTIALTPFDAYMMTTSGTYIKTEDLEEVMNQPIKNFIIGMFNGKYCI